MKKLNKALLAAAVSAAAFSGSTYADSFTEALKDGKANVTARYRIETVDEDNDAQDAFASTLLTRVTYETGDFVGFNAVIEFDQVSSVIFDEDFNAAGRDGSTDYSAVPDPEGTDLNESYVQYKAQGFTAKYGRQRIVLDDQRFFGGVAWRQNEQTFDAFRGIYKAEGLTATYAHISNRKNIFNELNDVKDDILNVQYKFNDAVKLTAYGYFLENANGTGQQDTIGVSLKGNTSKFTYQAELATQDGGTFEALYSHLAGSVKAGPVKLGLGREVLGSDDGAGAVGFKYGTNHKFNGWSDVFLGGAGANGLVDLYGSIGGKAGPVKLAAFYHVFESDNGGDDLGKEFNFIATGKAGPVALMFKYANYFASDFAEIPSDEGGLAKVDTQRVWLMSTYKF